MATTLIYCTNHPSVETLLRCNRCERPFCVKCLVRTPVGFRCRECLNIQQAGYYNATVVDYALTAVFGFLASIVSGALAALISGFWLFEIFFAPAAGGAISEVVGRAIGKHRGRYIWLVACAVFVLGSALGAMLMPLVGTILFGRGLRLGAILAAPLAALFNLGFLIYLPLAIGTLYARLR